LPSIIAARDDVVKTTFNFSACFPNHGDADASAGSSLRQRNKLSITALDVAG
jgi:hypothetical protein